VALAAVPAPKPGSADPIKPIMVRTVSVRRGSAPTATATGQAAQVLASAGGPIALASHDRPASTRPHVKGDWVIQVGAFPAESLAHDRLKEAQSMGRTVLTRAAPFTERVVKGDTTLYRARFAGFDRDAAEAACNYFKRNEIACLALKN
jgi:D-alanyl-D-alanine carboxypeptidase